MSKRITLADVVAYIGRTPILRKYLGKLIKSYMINKKNFAFSPFFWLAGRRITALPLSTAAIQLTGSSIKDNLSDAKVQFKTLYATVKRFHPDLIAIIADLTIELEACGCGICFPENKSPYVATHAVEKKEDITKLKNPDPYQDGRMPVVIETIRLLAKNLALPIVSGGVGPYTMAGEMAGQERVALGTITEPDFVESLLEYCTRVIINYSQAQIATGSDIILIGEPAATLLSAQSFERYSARYLKQIAESLDCPVVLHICGEANHLIEKACDSGAACLSVDVPVDIVDVVSRIPKDMVLAGNLDPVSVLLEMDKDRVREATLALLDKMRQVFYYIPSTGCDIPYETPLENIEAFVETVRNYH